MQIANRLRPLTISFIIGLTAAPAYGFDSQCEQVDGSACIAGPLTARSSWDTQESEHADIWRQAAVLAGLPEALSAPFVIKAYTSGDSIVSEGHTVPSLLPAPFESVTAQHTRTTSLPELTQLPDFSYALWDWTSGNETCPIGADIAPERCHQLKAHMGVVNSNHFLPQAFYAYRHYHQMALHHAAQCKRVATLARTMDQESLTETYLRPCEQLAMVYEAIGQHFLQDAWAMGHMWERWGHPNRHENTDHFDSLAVASTTALIHGARAGLQPALDFLGDFNDALSAPYHQEVRWKHTHSHDSHSAVGDMYLPHMLNHEGQFEPGSVGEFSAQAHMLFSCAVTSMLEVYQASGQHHGPARPVDGLLAVDPMSEEDCFGQRATNEAMLKGAGVDVLWGGFWPYHLEIDSYTSTLTVLAASTYYADNYADMSWGDYFWKQHLYRRDLARLMTRMELYAKLDPEGTQLASGAIGNLMNIKPNGGYTEAEGLADYVDLPPRGLHQNQDLSSAARESSVRLFHQAEGLTWCARYRAPEGVHALHSLRSQVSVSESQEAFDAACGLCTEVITRHVRRGDHRQSYDKSSEPLCDLAPIALKEAFRPTFVYQPGAENLSHRALAQAWCGCDP